MGLERGASTALALAGARGGLYLLIFASGESWRAAGI
jgi:hypothetical protein